MHHSAPSPSRPSQGRYTPPPLMPYRRRFRLCFCCRHIRFHHLRLASVPREGLPVGPEGSGPYIDPPQAQPGLARARRGRSPLGHLRPWTTTQPHTYSCICSTDVTHSKEVSWLGEGMKSSPAPRCEDPPAYRWGGGAPQHLTSVYHLHKRGERQQIWTCLSPEAPSSQRVS